MTTYSFSNRARGAALLFAITTLALGRLFAAGPAQGRIETAAPLRAVSYYISLRATLVTGTQVYLFGSSNLPAGSVLLVAIHDFIGQGSSTISRATVTVGGDGLFHVALPPEGTTTFKENMICTVAFLPGDASQPRRVVAAVGKHGERLGSWDENPQAARHSGEMYLEAITVVL